jgi:hypothetical protein
MHDQVVVFYCSITVFFRGHRIAVIILLFSGGDRGDQQGPWPPLRWKNCSYIPRFLGRKHPKTSKIYYLVLLINSSVLALCHWPPSKKIPGSAPAARRRGSSRRSWRLLILRRQGKPCSRNKGAGQKGPRLGRLAWLGSVTALAQV